LVLDGTNQSSFAPDAPVHRHHPAAWQHRNSSHVKKPGPAAQGVEYELREIAYGSDLAQQLMTGVSGSPVVALA
jgi:hypothetical protein